MKMVFVIEFKLIALLLLLLLQIIYLCFRFLFPGIVLDMASILEENHLCPRSSQLSSEQFCNAESIFVQDENKFIFNKIQTSQACFKLANSSKFPCVLILAIKSVGPKVRHLKSHG